MAYQTLTVVSSDSSHPIGELWAAQPLDGKPTVGTVPDGPPAADWPRDRWALLFAQPSQDLWALNLSSGVATEIQDGRGPQTASMRWDGTSR